MIRTPALRALLAAFTVSAIGFAALTPFLIIWARRDAHLGATAAGLLFVAQAVGELSGGLAGGALADRHGARRVLLLSTAGMALAYGLLAIVHAPGPAIALMFAGGLFEAAFHPTVFALLAELTPEADRASAYGILRAGGNLGTILGPLAGALIVSGGHLGLVFAFAGAALLAGGVIAGLGLPAGGAVDLQEEAEELREAVPGLAAITRDRRLGLLVACGTLLAVTVTWWEADGLVVLRAQRPFTASTFSLMLALSAALTVALQIPVSRLGAGRSPARLLGAGALVQALGLGVLALADRGLAAVFAAVALISLGQMLSSPQLSALVSRIAPAGRGAVYQAAMSMTQDIGGALGPLSGLALLGGVGAVSPWLLALPLGVLAALCGALAARRAGAPVTLGATDPAG